MAPVQHLQVLAGLETDPTLYHGEDARRPALLSAVHAERVLAHVATELAAKLPWADRCALTMPGALYNQAQVLRPGLPVFGALETERLSVTGNQAVPPLLAIGAEDGRMASPFLQPDRRIEPGPLQLLPVLLSCPAGIPDITEDDLERVFANDGLLSRAAVHSLEEHFQVAAGHARFMTIAHLSALLRKQLLRYGFLPLWELLDAAINAQGGPLEVSTSSGLDLRWADGAVHAAFETFDWWANYGSGIKESAAGQQLQTAYAQRIRDLRRYQAVLGEHGIPVVWHLPGHQDALLEGSFMVEESTAMPSEQAAAVTDHSAGDLGTVAVTVVDGARQTNLYPLAPEGLNDLHRYIREQGLGGSVDYPGRIRYDEQNRQLVAGLLPG